MNTMTATGLYGLLRVLGLVPTILAVITLILGVSHQKHKINVSRRLLIVLSAIAIALGVSVAGIAMLKDFADLVNTSSLLTTVCFAMLGLSCHKMRK